MKRALIGVARSIRAAIIRMSSIGISIGNSPFRKQLLLAVVANLLGDLVKA